MEIHEHLRAVDQQRVCTSFVSRRSERSVGGHASPIHLSSVQADRPYLAAGNPAHSVCVLRSIARVRYQQVQSALPDERSGRVVLLSHCLLNQNTRYLGGAVCPGVVAAALTKYASDGVGIIQLPCPEQQVWGGVLKTRFLWLLDHRWLARAGPLVGPLVIMLMRRRYVRLAKMVVDQVQDYTAAGMHVTAIVGVAGSPSCGVNTTMSLPVALTNIASSRGDALTTEWMNDSVVAPSLRQGQGLFMQSLRGELARRHLEVSFVEHDLALDPCKSLQRQSLLPEGTPGGS